jgi:hypothetical protein
MRFKSLLGPAALCVIGLVGIVGCGGGPEGRPSAAALGGGAYRSGFIDDKDARGCIGELLRNSGLRNDTLDHIARGDLGDRSTGWVIDEGESGVLESDVEMEMRRECGVEPFPGIDNWPGDPSRF